MGTSNQATEPAAPPRASVATATTLTAVGMMTMNVLVYLFTLAASHLLGPEHFSGVSAFLGVLLVANVGALAIQATAARRIATSPGEQKAQVTHDVIVSTWRTAIGLGALFTLASPIYATALHTSYVAALVVGLTVLPLTMVGGYLGALQGAERWTELAITFVAIGAGRAVFGVLAIAIDKSVTFAMTGVLIGAIVAAAVGWWFCRAVPHAAVGRHHPVLREVWHNGHGLLAFFVLTNLDVIVARNQFDHTQAGLYAAGSILTKTCLFLPQFVIIVAFPRMAQDQIAESGGRAWRKPLYVVIALGLCAVAGSYLLQDLAVTFVGGSAYQDLGPYAWLFTLEGTVFAALQMVVYRQIARQAHVAVYLWVTAVVTGVLAIALAETNQQLVVLVTVLAAAVIPVILMTPSQGRARSLAAAEPGPGLGRVDGQ